MAVTLAPTSYSTGCTHRLYCTHRTSPDGRCISTSPALPPWPSLLRSLASCQNVDLRAGGAAATDLLSTAPARAPPMPLGKQENSLRYVQATRGDMRLWRTTGEFGSVLAMTGKSIGNHRAWGEDCSLAQGLCLHHLRAFSASHRHDCQAE